MIWIGRILWHINRCWYPSRMGPLCHGKPPVLLRTEKTLSSVMKFSSFYFNSIKIGWIPWLVYLSFWCFCIHTSIFLNTYIQVGCCRRKLKWRLEFKSLKECLYFKISIYSLIFGWIVIPTRLFNFGMSTCLAQIHLGQIWIQLFPVSYLVNIW